MTRIAVPLRGTAQRFALASLILIAVAIMLLDRAGNPAVEQVRTSVSDLVTPALAAVSEPAFAAARAVGQVGRLADVYAENRRLREEVARLRAWHAAALRLSSENHAIRRLINYQGPERRSFISARVVADGRGPFVKSVLVNAGADDGIAKGQAAMTARGLVGRVTEAGDRSARVLLITDINSRIPVMLEASRTRAILAGDNSDRPELALLPIGADVSVGQRVVTSGHGGALPPGLPVGVVSAVQDGTVRVRPFVRWDRLEYLQVIDFDKAESPEVDPDAGLLVSSIRSAPQKQQEAAR